MKRRRMLGIAVLTAVLQLLYAYPAQAYIDIGTTGSMFAVLAPFAAVGLAFLGFLIRPFRVFIMSLVARFRGDTGAGPSTDSGLSGPDDSTDDPDGLEATGDSIND